MEPAVPSSFSQVFVIHLVSSQREETTSNGGGAHPMALHGLERTQLATDPTLTLAHVACCHLTRQQLMNQWKVLLIPLPPPLMIIL